MTEYWGLLHMLPFKCTREQIDDRAVITVIDINKPLKKIRKILDEHFVTICEGPGSKSDIKTIKLRVQNLFKTKGNEWIVGSIAEFFAHLCIQNYNFKQECLYINLEENASKKGFDGVFSKNGEIWLLESKAGMAGNSGATHHNKIKIAINDLSDKVSGKCRNDPWHNAYSHASHIDVQTDDSIRDIIKKLSDDYATGKFSNINEHNIIPCGTIFLNESWSKQNHANIITNIKKLPEINKGKNINIFAITHTGIQLFMDYIKNV